jgi:hypothetical protein
MGCLLVDRRENPSFPVIARMGLCPDYPEIGRIDMRKTIYKSVTLLAVVSAVLLLFSSCSGLIGGEASVRISVPGLAGSSDARFLSADATNGYVVVFDKNKVYSLNNFSKDSYHYLLNGQVYIAGLPVGDYIFGIVLMGENEGDNYGLAVKEVRIEAGLNDVEIEVGPGISSLSIGGIGDIDNPFIPDGYSVEFETDTMIFDFERSGVNPTPVTFNVSFGPSGPALTITRAEQIGGSGDGNNLPITGIGISLPADARGVRYDISSGSRTYSYTLMLK